MGNFPFGDSAANAARVSKFYRPETWIEGRSEDQLNHVASWDGISKIAAFPDLHPGRYGPVGAAFLSDRIYPQLIGPDIGCGMALFKLDMHRRKLKLDKASRRLRVLEHGAPKDRAAEALRDIGLDGVASPIGLGHVGHGNHFCELQAVEEIFSEDCAKKLDLSKGQLCLLVHTGSRNYGARIFSNLEAKWASGYLDGSTEASDYLQLHDRAFAWARINRQLIAEVAADVLRVDFELICDASHNHLEAVEDGWLHRKGAACPDRGYAPLAGSRESLSYLLSCSNIPDEALGSLSHGAGRRYDRGSMHGRIRKTRSGLAAMSKNPFGGQVICEDPALMIEEAGMAYKNAADVAADLEAFNVARRVASFAPLITFKTARTGDDT